MTKATSDPGGLTEMDGSSNIVVAEINGSSTAEKNLLQQSRIVDLAALRKPPVLNDFNIVRITTIDWGKLPEPAWGMHMRSTAMMVHLTEKFPTGISDRG
ncbi:MAG: hypothetical protein Q9187_008421 [Circinaria calcarea]